MQISKLKDYIYFTLFIFFCGPAMDIINNHVHLIVQNKKNGWKNDPLVLHILMLSKEINKKEKVNNCIFLSKCTSV